jgi:hypothetical protein
MGTVKYDIMKKCRNCHTLKKLDEYFSCKKKNGTSFLSQYCKTCKSLQASLKKRALKKKCIEYKGGKCMHCGLMTDHATVYDFHHLNPLQKDFTVSNYTDKKARNGVLDSILKAELDKCLLLCANCHRIEHDTLHGLVWNVQKPIKKIHCCNICGKEKSSSKSKLCLDCSIQSQRKIEWPTKEKLLALLEEYKTKKSVAKLLGVSSTAIRKKLK